MSPTSRTIAYNSSDWFLSDHFPLFSAEFVTVTKKEAGWSSWEIDDVWLEFFLCCSCSTLSHLIGHACSTSVSSLSGFCLLTSLKIEKLYDGKFEMKSLLPLSRFPSCMLKVIHVYYILHFYYNDFLGKQLDRTAEFCTKQPQPSAY